MEKYSALTTVYEKEKPEYLKQCLDSMLSQTVMPSEYVIVEDGPIGEKLEKVLNEYTQKYRIIKVVVLEKNSGLGVASNVGIEACSNDLIARLDSDDIALPERCEKELKMFEQEEDLVVVGTDMFEFEDNIDNIVSIKKMPSEPKKIYEFGKRRNPFNHSTVMMRKSIVQKYGGYSSMRRTQDLELFTRLLIKGCKCRNISEPLIFFRSGKDRIIRKKKMSSFKNDLAVYKRNYKEKYMSLIDYFVVISRQIIFYFMPNSIANYLYKLFYREKARKC